MILAENKIEEKYSRNNNLLSEANKPTKLNKNLRAAVRSHNYHKLKKCLDEGAQVNAYDENGKNALYYAVKNYSNSFDILTLLLEHGAYVEQLLYLAIKANKLEIVKWCVNKYPNSFSEVFAGITPLGLAAQCGHIEIVTSLLANNIEEPSYKAIRIVSPLSQAVHSGHHEVFTAILEYKEKFILNFFTDATIDTIDNSKDLKDLQDTKNTARDLYNEQLGKAADLSKKVIKNNLAQYEKIYKNLGNIIKLYQQLQQFVKQILIAEYYLNKSHWLTTTAETEAVSLLIQQLRKYLNEFSKSDISKENSEISKEEFVKNCNNALKTARLSLESPNWKSWLANIALLLSLAGSLFAIGSAIHLLCTGKFGFFRSNNVEAFEKIASKAIEVQNQMQNRDGILSSLIKP